MPPRFGALRRICESAVADGVVPGLVVLVGSAGRALRHEAFGHRQVVPRRLRATPDTVYDVASLTKALVTSVVALQLVNRGQLRLDDLVALRVPELRGPGKDKVTVRHLLAHASGLPAHRPFHRAAADSAAPRWLVQILAAREPLERAPGAGSTYSDIGFIVLGWLIERTAGARLDVLADRGIFTPLGLASTMFVSLTDAEPRARLLANRKVAATARCPERRRVLLGEVDDLNTHAMGGIAGHAGLFSTASDIGAMAFALIRAWQGGAAAEGALLPRDLMREMWSSAGIPGSTWRLGWDGPAASGSLAGDVISRAAVGHLGFTGCSLWIDPAREAFVILLANRVHPAPRDDPRFRALRRAVNDAALKAIRYRA